MLSLAEKGQRWNFTKKQSNWSRETYETCRGVQECKVKEVKECNSKGNVRGDEESENLEEC